MNIYELVERDKGRNIKAELEQSMAEMRKLQHPMKNLKIPVENNLDEIVVELERLGFKKVIIIGHDGGDNIYADSRPKEFFRDDRNLGFYKPTTLAELKEMK